MRVHAIYYVFFFFFKQKTAYEMRISDWSSDVCSSDLPIAADLDMVGIDGAPVHIVFDWRQQGPQTWDITVETDAGTLCLGAGGARLAIDGDERDVGPEREYPEIYARFARLIREERRDVDRTTLRLVADSFMRCRRIGVAPFED